MMTTSNDEPGKKECKKLFRIDIDDGIILEEEEPEAVSLFVLLISEEVC